jgi:hypothetical protein
MLKYKNVKLGKENIFDLSYVTAPNETEVLSLISIFLSKSFDGFFIEEQEKEKNKKK